MGTAEEGGNQPVRVLLVGGPKHGEFMRLPKGQDEYEFTSMATLSRDRQKAWERWPDSATHLYRLDQALSNYASSGITPIFTHEVLWGSPHHGGFNLYAIRQAEEALLDAAEDLKEAQRARRESDEVLKQALGREEAAVERAEALQQRVEGVRALLEVLGVNLTAAVAATGAKYRSLFD